MKKISELFNISYGNKFDLYKMTVSSKDSRYSVAFIARTKQNNGIVSYVEQIADIPPYPKGSVTVALGGSVLSSFLQYDDFYTAQNVAVLTPLIDMTDQIKIYYCTAIKKNAYRYSTCGREANKTFRDILIPDVSEIPNYVFNTVMPDYSGMLNPVEQCKDGFNPNLWKPFRYDELFIIKKGKRVTKLDLIPGNTPFISAIDKNNGIREFAGIIHLYDGNVITVNYNGSVGEAFYQEKPFWASDDVNVLCPNFKMNKYIAMFFITLIRREKYRFNYGRKWHTEYMNESIIKLPVKSDDSPDFEYMERYIKSLKYSSGI